MPFRGPTEEFSKLLGRDDGVELLWVKPEELDLSRSTDAIILPGSKRTIDDLAALRRTGAAARLFQFRKQGGVIVGVCGGYQILGKRLFDPERKQGNVKFAEGLGMLPLTTWFGPAMLSCRTQARLITGTESGGVTVGEERRSGYSLCDDYRGFTTLHVVEPPRFQHEPRPAPCVLFDGTRWAVGEEQFDGLVSDDERVIGTYLHCVFENEPFVRWFLSLLE